MWLKRVGIVATWPRGSSEELLDSVEEEIKLEDSARGGLGKSTKGRKDLTLSGDIRGERRNF